MASSGGPTRILIPEAASREAITPAAEARTPRVSHVSSTCGAIVESSGAGSCSKLREPAADGELRRHDRQAVTPGRTVMVTP